MSGAQEKVNILLIVADSGKEAVGRLPPFLAPPHRCNLCTKLCICAILCTIVLFAHSCAFAQFCTLCTIVLSAPCVQLCICAILYTLVLFVPCRQLCICAILYILCTYNVLFTHTLCCKCIFNASRMTKPASGVNHLLMLTIHVL